MYKVFTHLHACASRAVNLQHTALGAFSELVASAVLEITDAAAWLSLKANKPPHFSINVTKTAWHSPKWARFHCSSREAVDASTVYIERSFEMLASRLQLVFPVWGLSLLKHGHKQCGLGQWGRLKKQLWQNLHHCGVLFHLWPKALVF